MRPREMGLSAPAGFVPGAWGSGDLAILVPVIDPDLTPDEAISVATLRRFAPGETRMILKPESLTIRWDTEGFVIRSAPDKAMESLAAYNALMLSPWFYEALSGFAQVLVFQLDCLLLGPGLGSLARPGPSFIGAPYFRRNGRLKSVGNGGFSIRSPADALSVLTSRHLTLSISGARLRQYLKPTYFNLLCSGLLDALLNKADPAGGRFAQGYPRAEDEFWSYFAPLFSSSYRVADAMAGAAFAAESRPREVIRLNGGQLPLGAHAWTRHDRAFWEEILIALGFGAEVAHARRSRGGDFVSVD